jgi:hypothetical protein
VVWSVLALVLVVADFRRWRSPAPASATGPVHQAEPALAA